MRAFACVAGLAVGGALFARSAPSFADDAPSSAPSAAPAAPRQGPLVWYGWQTLLVDAAMTLGFFAPDASGARGYVAAGYVLGGPIIHIAHGQFARMAVSLAGRLLLPVVGAAVGAAVAQCGSAQEDLETSCWAPLVGAIVGAGVGVFSAMVTDAAISWERAPAPDSSFGRPASASWLVPVASPTIGSDRRPGFTLGVAGTF